MGLITATVLVMQCVGFALLSVFLSLSVYVYIYSIGQRHKCDKCELARGRDESLLSEGIGTMVLGWMYMR